MNGKKIKSGSEKSDMRNLRYYTTWRLDEQKSFKIVLTCTKEGYQRRSIKTFGLELKNSMLVILFIVAKGFYLFRLIFLGGIYSLCTSFSGFSTNLGINGFILYF